MPIIQFLSEYANIINTIFGICFGVGTLTVALWVALYSPQAVQAKIARKKHIESKRKLHYQRLKQEVFDPLSQGFFGGHSHDENESKKMKISFSEILKNPFYHKAKNHLNKDYPLFDTQISTLTKSVKDYNQQLERFFKQLDRDIETSFSLEYAISHNEITIQERNVIFVKQIRYVIIGFFNKLGQSIDWAQSPYEICSSCYNKLLTSSNANAKITLPSNHPIRLLGETVIFDDKTFLQYNPLSNPDNLNSFLDKMNEKEEPISKIICKIISNKLVFSKYLELDALRNKISQDELDLKNDVKKISELIEREDYETIADCCKDKVFL